MTDLYRRDVASARKLLERAGNLSPQNSLVTGILASTYQMTGDFGQAATLLASVTPPDGEAWYFGIVAYNATLLRNYHPAITMLKAQLSKSLPAVTISFLQVGLADLERHAGNADVAAQDYEQARLSLETVLREQTDNADLFSNLAWTEAFLGHKGKALDLARKAIALEPTSKNARSGPTYEETLARIQAHFGDKDNSIAALQHLLSIAYGGSPPVTPALLRADPDWDNLRGDPRFEKLCQEK